MKARCENCLFFIPPYDTASREALEKYQYEGGCARFKLMPIEIGKMHTDWPPVRKNWWCGEFQPRKGE